MEDVWEGTVVKKSRGLLDGSNMYRRLKVRLDDGTVARVRVDKDLWNAVYVGDTVARNGAEAPVVRRS